MPVHLPPGLTMVRGRARLTIDYRKPDGALTTRMVDVRHVQNTKAGEALLVAFCHLRGAERSFRVDRIEGIVTKDGEVLSPCEALRFLGVSDPAAKHPKAGKRLTWVFWLLLAFIIGAVLF